MNTIVAKILAPAALLGALALPLAAHADAPVNARLRHQQQWIHQSQRHDLLTRREAQRLEARDRNIARQERRDRFFHYGHLTAAEHRQIDRELSQSARAIRNDDRRGW